MSGGSPIRRRLLVSFMLLAAGLGLTMGMVGLLSYDRLGAHLVDWYARPVMNALIEAEERSRRAEDRGRHNNLVYGADLANLMDLQFRVGKQIPREWRALEPGLHFFDRMENFVFLEEHKGVRYTLTRSPDQMRPKRRGEGFTKEPASAEISWDGGVVTKSTEVNAKVSEILGIEFAQWKQVAMLAQGQFRELLDCSTEAREKVFRNIFSTEGVKRFQDNLQRMSRDAQEEMEKAEAEVIDTSSRLSIPAYRCMGGGEVKVTVTVNPAGNVIDAEIDESVSSGDSCLRSYAMRAAKASRFSAKSGAAPKEIGYIIYKFIAQ